jgi:hypothetical protein
VLQATLFNSYQQPVNRFKNQQLKFGSNGGGRKMDFGSLSKDAKMEDKRYKIGLNSKSAKK